MGNKINSSKLCFVSNLTSVDAGAVPDEKKEVNLHGINNKNATLFDN